MDKILVTRPVADFERTQMALEELGFAALSAPMMCFEVKKFDSPAVSEISALVFTSANGVRALAGRADLQKLPCYVVGEQSGKLAVECGFTVWAQGDGDVKSLSKIIATDYFARGLTKPLLHVSGVHQAGNLAHLLGEMGVKIERVQAYLMVETTIVDVEILGAWKKTRF